MRGTLPQRTYWVIMSADALLCWCWRKKHKRQGSKVRRKEGAWEARMGQPQVWSQVDCLLIARPEGCTVSCCGSLGLYLRIFSKNNVKEVEKWHSQDMASQSFAKRGSRSGHPPNKKLFHLLLNLHNILKQKGVVLLPLRSASSRR